MQNLLYSYIPVISRKKLDVISYSIKNMTYLEINVTKDI